MKNTESVQPRGEKGYCVNEGMNVLYIMVEVRPRERSGYNRRQISVKERKEPYNNSRK